MQGLFKSVFIKVQVDDEKDKGQLYLAKREVKKGIIAGIVFVLASALYLAYVASSHLFTDRFILYLTFQLIIFSLLVYGLRIENVFSALSLWVLLLIEKFILWVLIIRAGGNAASLNFLGILIYLYFFLKGYNGLKVARYVYYKNIETRGLDEHQKISKLESKQTRIFIVISIIALIGFLYFYLPRDLFSASNVDHSSPEYVPSDESVVSTLNNNFISILDNSKSVLL